jgi:SsrA-binding protein
MPAPKDLKPKANTRTIIEVATNRKAPRDFYILERFEAGVELRGTEVKSVRAGKINLSDAFARVENGQVFLYGCDIQPYENASHTQHEARRFRLLLHKREILKLIGFTHLKGLSLPVLRAYWSGKNVKMEIGVGRGKDQADKRQDIKERDDKREAARAMADHNKRKAG